MPLIEPFMSLKVLTAPPEQTLEEAAQSMTERRVGAVVITRGRAVVGIVTERDVLRSVSRGLVPWSTAVEVCMTHDPISITPGTDTVAASQPHARGRLPASSGSRGWAVGRDPQLARSLAGREAERIVRAKEERRRLAEETTWGKPGTDLDRLPAEGLRASRRPRRDRVPRRS